MPNQFESENHVETFDATGGVAPATPPREGQRKRVAIGAAASVAVLAIGGLAAWAGGLFGPGAATQVPSQFTKYDIQVASESSGFVDATRDDPLVLESASTAEDLIRGGMEWTVVVRNEGAGTGQLFFVICDPSSAKVKYRIAPGKDEIYPDLFTQLSFTVTDDEGTVVIDNEMLGADENNDPNGDGTVRGDISRVLLAGDEAEFTVKATFAYDPDDTTKTKLAAYSGVDTDFGIRIEGESF